MPQRPGLALSRSRKPGSQSQNDAPSNFRSNKPVAKQGACSPCVPLVCPEFLSNLGYGGRFRDCPERVSYTQLASSMVFHDATLERQQTNQHTTGQKQVLERTPASNEGSLQPLSLFKQLLTIVHQARWLMWGALFGSSALRKRNRGSTADL